MQYFDAHSHISFKEFNRDRDAVVSRMREAGVKTITVGVDLKSSKHALEVAEEYDEIFVSVGLHPEDSSRESFDEKEFGKLVAHKKVVSVGECGLDYFRNWANEDKGVREKRQKETFERQIEFSIKHDKPLMLHCRPSVKTMDAYNDTLSILKNYPKARGNVHFFVGGVDEARAFFEIGFTVSFTGVITFSSQYDEVVRFASLDMILTETDSPYATPVPYRGKRCEPTYVVEVAKRIAETRGISEEDVTKAILANTKRVFGV